MYIVSSKKSTIKESELVQIETGSGVKLPEAYRSFLKENGEGTYRGWMNVQQPDNEVLLPFAEYGIWEHDDESPITEAQIAACVSLGTSVDGDFLAVHPEVTGLLWLPRHDERITLLHPPGTTYPAMLDTIYLDRYGRTDDSPAWYEPWNEQQISRFFVFTQEEREQPLSVLSAAARDRWQPDFRLENEHSCRLFYQDLGGYLRFNYAYGTEVALFCEDASHPVAVEMIKWLAEQGGREMN